jgi:multifunctional beta-oxidation protein
LFTKLLKSYVHTYTQRDIILYALGVGCKVTDLQYIYEQHQRFKALPTFAVVIAHPIVYTIPLDQYIPNYQKVCILHTMYIVCIDQIRCCCRAGLE